MAISTMLKSINAFIPIEQSTIHTPFATALWQLLDQKRVELHHVPDRYSEAGKAAQTYDLLSNDQTNGVMMQARIGGAYNEIRLSTD